MDWIADYSYEKGFAIVTTSGEFKIEDHARLVEDLTSKDFWKPGTNVLFDHRNLEFCHTTMSLMQEAAENHKSKDDLIGDGKAAILMKSVVDFGRGRQFELLASDRVSARLRVFLDEKTALDWISE